MVIFDPAFLNYKPKVFLQHLFFTLKINSVILTENIDIIISSFSWMSSSISFRYLMAFVHNFLNDYKMDAFVGDRL